jgi:putative membrane protein
VNSDKLFFRFALVLSIVVFLLVLFLNRRIIPAPETYPSFVTKLPMLNAIINSTCSILLTLSFIAIKKKKITTHKRLNITTFLLSSIFLISYVVYHYFISDQSFGGEGLIRTIYFFVLFTHIPLAAVVLPLILLSFYYALGDNITKHRRIVRFAFPIWLYVTISGVLVYLMISPYYTF